MIMLDLIILSCLQENSMKRLPLFLSILFLLILSAYSSAQDTNPVYGILVDNTGTMRLQFADVQKLASASTQNAAEHGIVSLFAFQTKGEGNNAIAIIADGNGWSTQADIFEKYISGLEVVPGHTDLRDSILSVAEAVTAKAASESSPEKIVVLITDGEDRISRISEKNLIKELKKEGVKVYAIGLIQDLSSTRNETGRSPKSNAENFLKKMSRETGGNAIFPKLKKDANIKELLNEVFK